MKATVRKACAGIVLCRRTDAASRAVVQLDPDGETFLLRGRQHMYLEGAAGWKIRAFGGTVWITQDGDPRDIVLEAGQSFMADRDNVLMSPFGEARICVTYGADRGTVRRKVLAATVAMGGASVAGA